jgi:glycosyltransferase involved in cell wall biosynthesis
MDPVSVVIITKNESINIRNCIESARIISDDIIVIDSDSNDETVSIARQSGANVFSVPWEGYGSARNTGAAHAKNDWVLAIDADERVTTSLLNAIKGITNSDPSIIYGFKRQNYFLGRKIRFGEWGRDKVFRLYNRNYVSWDLSPVHEILIGNNTAEKKIAGYVNHFPVISQQQNADKTYKYARLNAQKYYQQGKKATFVRRYFSPAFSFVKTYILFLGFLDGKQGFVIAVSIAKYVWLKYKILYQLTKYS